MQLPIKDQNLLKKALTHRSYLNEDNASEESNERLEFLGDAVLELITSRFLFDKYPKKPEGELTTIRAALVKTTTLAEVAEEIGLGKQLLMSKGEDQTGGRQNQGLLADTFEAVLGAIYLDSSIETVTEFLQTHLFPRTEEIVSQNLHRDYKSTFQERIQADGLPTPTYEVVNDQGPDHDKTFTVAVMVKNQQFATGTGKSKQAAQQQAAEKALEKLDQGNKL